MDFFQVKERSLKRDSIELYPDFFVCRSKDLMVRGKAFYAVYDESSCMWCTDEYRVAEMIDDELYKHKENMTNCEARISVKSMKSFGSKSWTEWKNYLSRMPDTSHLLDSKVIFQNTKVKKTDYVSKRLPYNLGPGDYSAYDTIMSTLYSGDEREKIEWAIGSIIAGDSKNIQKFIVLYGEAGSGKSTVLNIIQQLFEGYYVTFEAKALASNNGTFSMEAFRSNPLVAIQHDGDLSRIEDNTKINSIVSHEEMIVNEKFKSTYSTRMNAFLFMGTNKPVKITDAKSGIIRRLIDVHPSGTKLPTKRYFELIDQVPFELGAIAQHCLDVYSELGKDYYSTYKPFEMMYETDVFYNFVEENYDEFKRADEVTLKRAYCMYKEYCDEASVEFKLPMYKFRTELKEYFSEFFDRVKINDTFYRSVYRGFRVDKFNIEAAEKGDEKDSDNIWIALDCTESLFDREYSMFPAQYASDDIPESSWKNVKTYLQDLDTHKLHYVKVPIEHVVIDFDIRDETGEKNAEMNIKAASKFPPTYAEYSKSGKGVHLHYIYDGDPKELSRVYSEGIEVKVFNGNSSLRRRLSFCNDLPIAHISSGLPKKEKKVVVSEAKIKSEKGLRDLINRNLLKEIHGATKPSMDFIQKILDDAYESGISYDVSDMRSRIFSFASGSTNQADACIKMVGKLKFKSRDRETDISAGTDMVVAKDDRLVFFDCEVFPNLFLINWKFEGTNTIFRMINPTPEEVGELFKHKLVGFNCRRYDNHILYGRYLGYTNEQLYDLSQRIVSGNRGAMFSEAYNISYTDIYDFSSKKQSLKKFEIELGIHHQELGLPWDQPVDEKLWTKVAEYCDNDVIATEAVFNDRKGDWLARQVLADVAGLSVNDTTNTLTTKIIFGDDRKPQSQFNYRFMGEMRDNETYILVEGTDPNYTVFDPLNGKPIFPGYKFDAGKSTYRDEEVGEGGYVYAEPGMYFNVALLDVASMHPSSIVAEELFGPYYTQRFNDILQARIAIKHGDFDKAKTMLDGKLAPYLEDKDQIGNLTQALKIAINSVYGLTSAKFENPFRDIRNKDNIVAKRGALFMINLKHEVQARGFKVAHIKTDSIKIPNATPEIISFVQEYGKHYGYSFEHEATYDRMCLVNDAVYIARYATVEKGYSLYGKNYVESNKDILKDNKKSGPIWTATGAQFAQPYVFKTLFSKEPIDILDMSETKTVTSALYLDMNETLGENEHDYHFVGKAGLFCPILPGHGGGELVREKDGKYYSATGAKGYRWLEYETVKLMGYEEFIDQSYYRKLVDDAISDISEYGDFEMFANGEAPNVMPESDPPCGLTSYKTCFDCPRYLSGCDLIDSRQAF